MTVPILTEGAPQTIAGLASKEAGIVKLSAGQAATAGGGEVPANTELDATFMAQYLPLVAMWCQNNGAHPTGVSAIRQAGTIIGTHAATVAGLRAELDALKARFQTSGDESTAAYNAASKRAAAAEGLLREALQSFLCTQRPNDYSRLHWSNKAIAALDAALGEATSPGAERGGCTSDLGLCEATA